MNKECGVLKMKNFKVGIQLYSVRDHMQNDFYGTLKAVKEVGFDYVEFAGYFGKSAEEIRAMLDELGLECISVHEGAETFLEQGKKAVDFLTTIGAKYSAIPWYPIDKLKGNFDETVEKFKKVSDILSEGGIRLAYHNHDFEFQKLDGEYILDKIYAATDGKLEGEVDTCWVHYAGVDPAEYLLKYKGQMNLLHLKDFECENLASGPVYELINSDESNADKNAAGFKFKPLGEGRQDFVKILEAAEEVGIEYVIYEMDDTYEQDSIEAAAQSRKYLKDTFGI